MRQVPFIKYTSCGNNFIIIDESISPILPESEKAYFASQVTNPFFGIGADGCIFLQSGNAETFQQINETFRYWRNLPDIDDVDYIFRLFEPDGSESLSCGNGLLCIAHYLYRRYGTESAQLMTEIPSIQPNSVPIGFQRLKKLCWANMGRPRHLGDGLVNPKATKPYDNILSTLNAIEIRFRRKRDANYHFHNMPLPLTGYLLFTGEPHLVVFTENGDFGRYPSSTIFASSQECQDSGNGQEHRLNTGSWLVEYIGNYAEREYKHIFPHGINIDFVRVIDPAGIIEYRCYERGVSRETLACGTGAVAVSFVAKQLKLLKGNNITVWPHRCRWHKPDARLLVWQSFDGWLLHGDPVRLCEGVFLFNKTYTVRSVFGHGNRRGPI